MTDSLRAEVVPPRRKSGWLLLLAPLTAQLAVMATCQRTERVTVFTPPELPKARVISSDIHLVFRDGDHSYMHLGPGENADVAGAQRAWLGKKVFVDNDCTATVTGFRIIERIASDQEDVNEGEGEKVLAAELDRCDGTYARSAELPMVVVPETRPDDAELVKKAKRELLHSPAADETTQAWVDAQSTEDWKSQAQYDIRTLRHPITGQTWISIHAWNDAGCGDPGINVWGLFLVNPDGTLTTKQMRDLGDMTKIEQIIDVEGDGELELIGTPWLGLDKLVTRASGDEIERLPLPYAGCPC